MDLLISGMVVMAYFGIGIFISVLLIEDRDDPLALCIIIFWPVMPVFLIMGVLMAIPYYLAKKLRSKLYRRSRKEQRHDLYIQR